MNPQQPPNGIATDDQLIDQYKRYKRHDWKSGETRRQRGYILNHLTTRLPNLLTVTEHDLQDWHDSLDGATETTAAYVSTCKGLFAWMAAVAKARPDNPAALLRRPSVPAAQPRPILERHYELALACATGSPEIYLWLGLMGCAGMRCCEVAWLRTTDIEELPSGQGFARFVGKGAKRRTVPLAQNLMYTLRPFLVGGSHVFTRRSDGKPHTPCMVSKTTNRFLRDLGIHETAHQLRHRFGTDYHEIDPDLLRQARLMGHSSVVTTQRYTEVSPMEAAHHIERLAAKWLGRQGGRSAAA